MNRDDPLILPKASGSRAVDIATSASEADLRQALLEQRAISNEEALRLLYDFTYWARPEQLPPPGDWRIWAIITGRAWGKTRTGSEWIRQRAYDGHGPIAIVGKTAADCRDIMILGPAGIMACSPPWFKPQWEPSKRRVTWPNGVYATTFGGDEPDQLRGPAHASGWLDELAKWSQADEAFSNFEMGLRVGNEPRAIITTTPRPIRIMRQLLSDPHVYVQRGHSYENRANLPPDFIERVEKRYAGTRLGRQELGGEMLDDTPGALWNLGKMIDPYRVKPSDVPTLRQIVIGVDPSATDYNPDDEDRRGSECGIIVAGIGGHRDEGYVLHDGSDALSPREWAERVVELYYTHNANYVVAERNNGGGMVRETIHAVDDRVPVLLVWASQGKETRAEPVSLLYEQGRVHHAGTLPELEDQMCSFVPRDRKRQPSDRMDALVWAFKHLLLGDDKMPHYDPTRHRVERFRRSV